MSRRVIGVALAAVLAVGGTAALVAYVQSEKDAAVANEALVPVFIVQRTVPALADATAIQAAIRIEQVPARLKQTGAVTDAAQIGAQVATVELEPGDQLITARLMTPKSDEIPKGFVQVGLELKAEQAVGGVLAKNDIVGVYTSYDSPDPAVPATSKLEIDHVRVYNVQNVQPVVDPKDGTVTAPTFVVTLVLTPEQGTAVTNAQLHGHVWLSHAAVSA